MYSWDASKLPAVDLRQVTALGNTKLLERVSSGLVAIRNLFSQFDINKDNVIERDEFASVRLPARAAPASAVTFAPPFAGAPTLTVRCSCSSMRVLGLGFLGKFFPP